MFEELLLQPLCLIHQIIGDFEKDINIINDIFEILPLYNAF